MFLMLTKIDGKLEVFKKTDVTRVYDGPQGTIIARKKPLPSVTVKLSVEHVFDHLMRK